MILSIITGKDPRLSQVCRPVDLKEDAQALNDLRETFLAHGNARGLAAPQLGLMIRAFVVRTTGEQVILMVNPIILSVSTPNVILKEECLSFPWLGGVLVSRPQISEVRWQSAWESEQGAINKFVFYGWDSRVIHHELDHLNGITIETHRRRK